MIKGTRTKQTLAYRTTLVHRSEDITVVKLDKPTKNTLFYTQLRRIITPSTCGRTSMCLKLMKMI